MTTARAPLLLYDGTCGFCQASVQFVLRHERDATLRFAALQGSHGVAIRARHPVLASADTVVWVSDPGGPNERVLLRSDAALEVAHYLGGAWRTLRLARWVPRFLRDAAYRLVARYRHRLPSAEVCELPSADTRSRFLD